MELLRLRMPGLTAHAILNKIEPARVSVCGLVITRQRPGTASGVVFLTLEDETGVSNIVVWPGIYEQYRRTVMSGRLLRITGMLQRADSVVHVIAQKIEDMSYELNRLGHPHDEMPGGTLPKTDNVARRFSKKTTPAHHPREQAKKLFPSRDFH